MLEPGTMTEPSFVPFITLSVCLGAEAVGGVTLPRERGSLSNSLQDGTHLFSEADLLRFTCLRPERQASRKL